MVLKLRCFTRIDRKSVYSVMKRRKPLVQTIFFTDDFVLKCDFGTLRETSWVYRAIATAIVTQQHRWTVCLKKV